MIRRFFRKSCFKCSYGSHCAGDLKITAAAAAPLSKDMDVNIDSGRADDGCNNMVNNDKVVLHYYLLQAGKSERSLKLKLRKYIFGKWGYV